jgi:hypothetical protein
MVIRRRSPTKMEKAAVRAAMTTTTFRRGFKYCASNVGLAGPKIFFSLLVLIVDRFPHVAVPTMILSGSELWHD